MTSSSQMVPNLIRSELAKRYGAGMVRSSGYSAGRMRRHRRIRGARINIGGARHRIRHRRRAGTLLGGVRRRIHRRRRVAGTLLGGVRRHRRRRA